MLSGVSTNSVSNGELAGAQSSELSSCMYYPYQYYAVGYVRTSFPYMVGIRGGGVESMYLKI